MMPFCSRWVSSLSPFSLFCSSSAILVRKQPLPLWTKSKAKSAPEVNLQKQVQNPNRLSLFLLKRKPVSKSEERRHLCADSCAAQFLSLLLSSWHSSLP